MDIIVKLFFTGSAQESNSFYSMDGFAVLFIFVFALVSHAEGIQFLSQNGITRKTYASTALLDGVIYVIKFILFTALLTIVAQSIKELFQTNSTFLFFGEMLSIQNLESLQNLPLLVIRVILIGLVVYFFGHCLSSINYYLGTKGKLIFWVLFGLLSFIFMMSFIIAGDSIFDGGIGLLAIRGVIFYPLIKVIYDLIMFFLENPSYLYLLGILLTGFFALVAYVINQKTRIRETGN